MIHRSATTLLSFLETRNTRQRNDAAKEAHVHVERPHATHNIHFCHAMAKVHMVQHVHFNGKFPIIGLKCKIL